MEYNIILENKEKNKEVNKDILFKIRKEEIDNIKDKKYLELDIESKKILLLK